MAVDRLPFVFPMQTHQAFDLHILIQPLYVREGVVEVIVLNLPGEGIAAKQIDAVAHHAVEPTLFAPAAVQPIVHDIHSNAGHSQAHERPQGEGDVEGHLESQENAIGDQISSEHDHRFDHQMRGSSRLQFAVFDKVIHTLVHDFLKLCELLGSKSGEICHRS